MYQQITAFLLSLVLLSGCSGQPAQEQAPSEPGREVSKPVSTENLSGTIPDELEYVPEGYTQPAEHQGTLERLEYETWESFSYEEQTQELTKTAWVYLPYGYDESRHYNILYLSHGGWSNETTVMGTSDTPHEFRHIVDHSIEDGKIQPLIIVLPTYNNTSESDSGSYSLALRLVDNFHNELVNDLIPAVEENTAPTLKPPTPQGLPLPGTTVPLEDFPWAA